MDWSAAADAPVAHINQIAGQLGPPSVSGIPDGVYLTLGSITPPVLIARDAEARARALEALKEGLKIAVHGHFHMSRDHLGEIIKVLKDTAEQYDAAIRHARDQG